MKKTSQQTIELSKSEVLEAVADYITKKLTPVTMLEVKMEPIFKHNAIRGMDIHDCEWKQVFSGMKVIIDPRDTNDNRRFNSLY